MPVIPQQALEEKNSDSQGLPGTGRPPCYVGVAATAVNLLMCIKILSKSRFSRMVFPACPSSAVRVMPDSPTALGLTSSPCAFRTTYCIALVRPPGDLVTSGGPGLIRSNPGHLLAWPQSRLRRHAQALGALCVIDLH